MTPSRFVLGAAVIAMTLTSPGWAGQRTATMDVPGMDCATCPMHVKHALVDLGGVLTVNWDIARRQVEVVFDDAKISLEQITAATARAGFPTNSAVLLERRSLP